MQRINNEAEEKDLWIGGEAPDFAKAGIHSTSPTKMICASSGQDSKDAMADTDSDG